jgi:peptidoglycan-associated lipoprotein
MFRKSLITLVTVLVMAGCASKGTHDAKDTMPAPVDTSSSNAIDNGGAPVQIGDSVADDSASRGVGLFDSTQKANIIYFAFDSSELSEAGIATADKFGKYLTANPSTKVRIEGNTDERGTREYNVGLGERRANSVQSALLSRGVSAAQISVVSYGEERPAAQGHDESAWSQNRRAVVIRQ